MTIHTFRLPSWLSTGMIFQQGVPLTVYGYSDVSTSVRIEVVKDPTDGRKVSKLDTDYGIIWSHETKSDTDGKFSFELPAYKPSTDAYTFIFSTALETVSVKDLRCGDVWLFIGSVPLSIPIADSGAPRTPLKDSALQQIRFFVSPRSGRIGNEAYSVDPLEDMKSASWITMRAGRALAGVSSVGFSLAYHLADQLHYPVGIVDLAVADSSVVDWISRKTIEEDDELKNRLIAAGSYVPQDKWELRPVSGSQPDDKATSEDETIPFDESDLRMSALYNHKLHPLRNLNIRGILFAPDASDCRLTEQYESLLEALLVDLSAVFGPRKYPGRHSLPSLIMMQLRPKIYPGLDPYAHLRFNETLCAIRRKFPMKIGILGCHDMLLPDKSMPFIIGRRLSFIALGLHFTPKMPTSSPECIGVEVVGSKVMLSFDNTSDGLKLSENESILRGFALCGADRVYRPAQAKILHGVRVMVWHDDIPEPCGVTYGFSPIPHEATFKSRADLPVLPFRFDRAKAVYSPDLSFTYCDRLEVVGIESEDADFSLLPVFRVVKGSGRIFSEALNKTEGSASLRIEYVPEDNEFAFEPILTYLTTFAPLDLKAFRRVCIDVFNPDLQEKRVHIEGFAEEAKVKNGLKWQTIELVYREGEPMLIDKFVIRIHDENSKGSLYIDHIRFMP